MAGQLRIYEISKSLNEFGPCLSIKNQKSKMRNFLPGLIHSVLLLCLLVMTGATASSQDWIRTGTNRGAPIRMAVPDFKAATNDPQTAPLNTVFNQTLWSDLDNSGIFEMVAKSFYPLQTPGSP